jgi:hypothetical protein
LTEFVEIQVPAVRKKALQVLDFVVIVSAQVLGTLGQPVAVCDWWCKNLFLRIQTA